MINLSTTGGKGRMYSTKLLLKFLFLSPRALTITLTGSLKARQDSYQSPVNFQVKTNVQSRV